MKLKMQRIGAADKSENVPVAFSVFLILHTACLLKEEQKRKREINK
jgi:hypothetical protein